MRANILKILIFLLVFWGCQSGQTDILHKGTDKRHENNLAVKWDSLAVDIFYTSGQGNFFMRDSVISFADRYYAKLYNYDCKTGSLLSSKFGLGHGPDEMLRYISAHPVINDTVIMFIDGNGIITLCGTNSYQLYRKRSMDFKWNNKYSANYNSPEIYGFQYEPDIYNYHGKYIIPVSPLWHRMNTNGFIPSNMYKKSHILGLLDLNTMEVSDLFGNFPPVYSEKSIPQYSDFFYTFHQDTVYTSFSADPLIHVYKYPDKYLYSFGYECIGIDRSYTATSSFLDD
jgi:hypothetical protein